MRDAFSNALVAAAKNDPKVLLLTGDHGYALFDAFRKSCPDQYINCGIAEQNMMAAAGGMAAVAAIFSRVLNDVDSGRLPFHLLLLSRRLL